jgi:streptogramin lyase
LGDASVSASRVTQLEGLKMITIQMRNWAAAIILCGGLALPPLTLTTAARAGTAPPGTVTLFTTGVTPNSGPEDIVTGPDGNLWFTQPETNEIGQIDPRTGAVTEYTVPAAGPGGPYSNYGPWAITVGLDGNLWFTEIQSNLIGRLNPWTKEITEFSAGLSPGSKCQSSISAGAGPFGITAGYDGNLWFAEFCGDRIGRINPWTGKITEFSKGLSPGNTCRPALNSSTIGTFPSYITAGTDGRLWFTEFCGNKIGAIDPRTGTITEYSNGIGPKSGPDGITAGPDGNIWLALQLANEIGRLNPWTKEITEFSTGISPSAGPIKITSGPDGNLWFTEDGELAVGARTGLAKVNPWTGAITELPALASGAFAVGITAGPDRNIWFTEYNANAVGRLTLTPTTR